MKEIHSRHNELVKKVVTLQTKKGRLQYKEFIAQGLRTCSTLLQAGYQLNHVLVSQKELEVAKENFLEEKIILVSDSVMQKISTLKTPSGLLAIFTIPEQPKPEQLTAGLVCLHMNNPGNVGTLIRSAAAMNITSVVLIESVDPWNPKVVQATAGTIGFVTIFQWTWHELLQNKRDLQLIALVALGGKKPQEVDLSNSLFVIGSEAHGIAKDQIADCDLSLTLPMPGKTESLNAAVAGSIILYLSTATQK